jgi:hypothetical protein
VNLGKLAVWSPTASSVPEDVALLGVDVWKADLPSHDCGIKIVGAPIGHVDYIVSVGVQKLGEEAQLISSLLKLPSIQIAWLLLYFCVVPKINHFLRTLCPCDVET